MKDDWIDEPVFRTERPAPTWFVIQIAAVLLLALLLSACGKRSELDWTEDVKLPDGRVVRLSRWVEFKGGSSHLGDPSTESRQRFEFRHPDSGEIIKWQNTMEQGTLRTIALWLDRGQPLLLGQPAYGGDLYKYKCPNPPYLLFEYVAGQWRSKALAQIPISQIRANLTFSPLEKRDSIEQSGRHLTTLDTSNSYTYLEGVHATPYVIRFEGMPKQTFDDDDCDRVSNLKNLILVEGK